MIGIYRITNRINGKFYIGQSKDVAYRIKQHNFEANDPNNLAYNTPLHQDIREYGWDNFFSEVLLECEPSELSLKEQELISAAQILSKDLIYNKRNDFIVQKIGQFTLEGKLVKIWNSTKELRDCGIIETGNILKACRGVIKSSIGYLWRLVEDENDAKNQEKILRTTNMKIGAQRREIIQYDLITHAIIKQHPSGRAAAFALGKKSGTSPILNTCKGKQRQAYGYGWAYADDFEKIF